MHSDSNDKTCREQPGSTNLGGDRADRSPKPETGLVRLLPIDSIQPSPENDQLYRPIDLDDPEFKALVASIREHGVKEPLVVTRDKYILGGHRRHAAARAAGFQSVPCRYEDLCRGDDIDRFVVLLREYNRQRVKSFDEVLREEAVSADPGEAYEALVEEREKKSAIDIDVDLMDLGEFKARAEITKPKLPMLEAIGKALLARKKFWPLSKRKIHYVLLNDPPLRHASKPGSRYVNNSKCYKDLVDLTTRACLAGLLPWGAFADDTRPVITWSVYDNASDYMREEFANFMQGYWRNLMQSQWAHFEIVGEKVTELGVLRPVASEYAIPLTLGRGFCSTDPRKKMAMRFKKSGKDTLFIFVLSDFDPEGDVIAQSFARSMRDEFDIPSVKAVKVMLTHEQVQDLELPPNFEPAKAKVKSVNRAKFIEKYGSDEVFELEAVPEMEQQQILRDAIDSVLDMDAFNHERRQEAQDAASLVAVRQTVLRMLETMGDIGGAGNR